MADATQLAMYQQQLAAVEAQIAQNPGHTELVELRNNLREYIELTRDLLGMPSTAAPAALEPSSGPSGAPAPVAAAAKARASRWGPGATAAAPIEPRTDGTVAPGAFVSVPYPGSASMVNATVAAAAEGGKVKVALMGYGQTVEVEEAAVRAPEFAQKHQLYPGLYCEGIYSQDQRWYTARIDAVNADGTYAVTYTDYGNSESLDRKYLRLNPTLNALNKPRENAPARAAEKLRELAAVGPGDGAGGSGGKGAEKKRKVDEEPVEDLGEFVIPEKLKLLPTDSEEVKAAKRKKVHALKSAHRLKADQNEKQGKAQAWNSFTAKTSGKKTKGFLTGAVKKESMFRTSEVGRVGFIGSGRGISTAAGAVNPHAVHAHAHVHVHAHARTHGHTHTHARTHTYTRTHKHTHARAHTHAHARTHTRSHAHARTHTHSHTLSHTHAGATNPHIVKKQALEAGIAPDDE